MQEEMLEHWAAYYVSYKRLKQFVVRSPLQGERFHTELFRLLREELERAERHFRELLEELTASHDQLLTQEPEMPQSMHRSATRFFPQRRTKRRETNEVVGDGEYQPVTGGASGNNNNNASMTEMGSQLLVGGSAASYTEVEPEDSAALFGIGEDSVSGGGLKGWFLRLIGDSRRRKNDASSTRTAFVEWYASAHRLQHFAELNLEAIRKTLKKIQKHRQKEGDFTSAIETEILMSPLTTLVPRLHLLMEHVDVDFQRKFNEPLDHYKDITIVTKEHWHAKWHFVVLSWALFCITYFAPLFESNEPAHNCAALFVLVVSMWITEAIPFFCTAMLIPIVAVPLSVLQDPATGAVASPVVASRVMLGHVFDHVQILVLGGLTIAKALAKANMEVIAASWLHRYTAHRPSLYLLGVMVFSCLLCSFVSNVAAPLLVLGVIQTTLWEFPSETNAPRGILLGLAMACNLGGMLSPIASPQNAVAMQVLSFHNISFATWVLMAAPVVLVGLVASWLLILWIWKPFEAVAYIPLQVTRTDANPRNKPRRGEVLFVLIVSGATVILWCLPASWFFGDTGIIALIPIVLFFGVGVLKKEDFNTLSWHLMFLLAGGNMLGVCARDSHMIDLIADGMKSVLEHESPYTTIVLVIVVVGLVTTFVSHTVAAMIMLPIIVKIGYLMPESAANGGWSATPASLVFLSVMMCSGAMAFPISSFPNVNSLLAEDELGVPYLKARDFLFLGTAVTFVVIFSLISWMVPYTAAII